MGSQYRRPLGLVYFPEYGNYSSKITILLKRINKVILWGGERCWPVWSSWWSCCSCDSCPPWSPPRAASACTALRSSQPGWSGRSETSRSLHFGRYLHLCHFVRIKYLHLQNVSYLQMHASFALAFILFKVKSSPHTFDKYLNWINKCIQILQ